MRQLLLAAILMLSACQGCKPRPHDGNGTDGTGKTPPGPPATVLDRGDQVLDLLRQRVSTRLGDSDEFRVIVTDADYPIGTIMEEGRTAPTGVNSDACQPTHAVSSYELPNMFSTSILMKGSAAAELGLDSEALGKLAQAGVKAGQNDVFSLTVHGAAHGHPVGTWLLKDEFSDLLAQPKCANRLKGQTYLVVRGYVTGIRTYDLGRSSNVGANLGVSNVGSFKVDASRDSDVSLSDEAPTDFLQIVSKVALPGPPPPPPPPPAQLPPFTGPQPLPGLGPVYVQRDKADHSDNASKILDMLSDQRFSVIYTVEAIESDKVPKTAQVRYFNPGDEGAADKAVAVLKQLYPSAAKLFVGLKAPKGQLEVWLPRAGLSAAAAAGAVYKPPKLPPAALVASHVH